MSDHYDELETLDPGERERRQFQALSERLREAVAERPGLARHLEGSDLDIGSRDALAKLPVLRKIDLMAAQREDPPFGGFVADGYAGRIFMSPGPVWEPEAAEASETARALFAAGIRSGDRVHNALGYHMTPGGFILDAGALALGCTVFPAGAGNTQSQIDAIAAYKPSAYLGTPDYLKTLLDAGTEAGRDLSSIRRAFVSGGALFPSMRAEYAERGVTVMQGYATADLGMVAYETATDGEVHEGMVCTEKAIVEIVRPGTGDPVADGEVGEIVVTSLSRNYPLFRFATGDLSKFLSGTSVDGRTNRRIAGWMGRADQRTKVKGMFVDPAQVASVVRKTGLAAARLVVSREGDGDAMELIYRGDAEAEAVADALRSETGLRGTARRVEELPNDGKVIADERDYEG